MCGIAGIYHLGHKPANKELLHEMLQFLKHRGPNDEGTYFDSSLGLGHRRLSILDLSSAGHQPMSNMDGTIWLVFNGEIYNYKSLRDQLKSRGYKFQSQTDTEVILHAYEEFGVDCLQKFNGMWAFALWDSRKKRLFCSRDRFGIKPFYYYLKNQKFLFASEIKALLCDSEIPRQPNDQVIYEYLVFDRVDYGEETFFAGIKQLLPAHYLVIERGKINVHRYWDLNPKKSFGKLSLEQAGEKFLNLLEDSVSLRLQSDVSLGSCLSGGIDSSSIVCLINRLLQGNKGVHSDAIGARQKTFSSCFEDLRFDEREYIETVTSKTGALSYYIFPKGEELFNDLPHFLWHQEQPVVGTSQYAQWCVMKLVHEEGVKVILDGQGGDELMAGYPIFFRSFLEDLILTFQWNRFSKESKALSEKFGFPYTWKRVAADMIKPYFPNRLLQWRRRLLGRYEDQVPSLSFDFLRKMTPKKRMYLNKYSGGLNDHLYRLLTADRLPSLLRYEDRSSMAFSIEARVPFLDHRVVELVFALPNKFKIKDGTTKILLRQATKGILPEKVRSRMDKMGFVTPQTVWFRQDFRNEINEIFHSKSFEGRQYFNHRQVRKDFSNLCSGFTNNSNELWRYINLELWMRMFIDEKSNLITKDCV